MQASKGNDKLGNGCLVVSRAVGDTCPPTCDFLGRIISTARNNADSDANTA